MFSRVNIWQIAELKVIGKIKFGEWIDFGHKDTIYQLKFGLLKFGESRTTCQLSYRQTFLLYGDKKIKTLYGFILVAHICTCTNVCIQ